MNKEVMKQVLEALKNNRRKHYGCEDSWYSCPKHEDGCYNEDAGSECNCGADEANAEIDAAIKVLQEAQTQRPWVGLTDDDEVLYPYPPAKPPIYATAKNTKSVRDGYELGGYEKEAGYYSEQQLDEFAKTIEAKLKEKNI